MFPEDTGRRYSVKAIFAVIFYLIMPIMAIYIIMESYPELSRERYMQIIWAIIPFAIVMVIISQLSIRYPKGDVRRLALNLAYVVTALLWLLAFLGGGMVLTQDWGPYEFSLHLEKYIILILAVSIFNSIYYVMEWMVYASDDDEDEKMPKSKQEVNAQVDMPTWANLNSLENN